VTGAGGFSLFSFDAEELLSFFAVLVRFSVLVAVMPFVGDRFVPGPVKVLLALAISICVFPALLGSGQVRPQEARVWAATSGGIIGVVGAEAVFALVLGFTAKFAFDAISFGGNLVGGFMGFASASMFDPHQETQTQVVAEVYAALAMLLFLALDGHHLILRASLDSYRIMGLGGLLAPGKGFTAAFSERLVEITGQVVRFGVQLAAPVAVSMFAVNVAFGVMSRAMPQLNVLVLSFAVTAIVGLFVILLTLPEFQGAAGNVLGRAGDWMGMMAAALAGKGR
jgi:flagellar biosynthesis protein FliR